MREVAHPMISRRDWLGSMLLGAGLAASGDSHAARLDAGALEGLPDLADPAISLRNLVRLQGSLQEEDVPWWFTGTIFGVRGDNETPRPLLRFEGMEIYWFAHRPDGYLLGGHTVTFFRDLETGQFLREFKNPWTGRLDEVKPAVQGGNLGFHYGTDGIWPVRLDGKALIPPQRRPLALAWHVIGEQVWLQHQTVYPPGMPPMHGQRQSIFTSRQAMQESARTALPATFSSTVFMGWLKWMDMQSEPGHVIWHASGAKLRGIDELPREYRERVERDYPERLSARPRPIA